MMQTVHVNDMANDKMAFAKYASWMTDDEY